MKTKSLLCLAVLCGIMLCPATLYAQTYAYRMVKIVSQYDEVTNLDNGRKVYVVFSDNMSRFYLGKQDGSRAGWPDASTGYVSGFANQDISSSWNGYSYSGISHAMRDPLDFHYVKTENGNHLYEVSRPLLALSGRSIYVTGYTTDQVWFSGDFSRINTYISPEKGMYGFEPFVSLLGYDLRTIRTFVFEKVVAPNNNPGGAVMY